ncbi:hypothetical protein BDV25DRAFT_153572 [Aspergillus avenaceus]|uniref:Uncharacterized protein n=1 Tax=Aspergillus avenaceus TaxID=36643 RepID=A0A5N6TWV3_ASPAV|nr:hypothetical protein BDV25DRAFT_153572 [Aspergillus avenaceus]
MKPATILAVITSLCLSGAVAEPLWYSEVHDMDVCWRACFHDKPHCPSGWHPKKFGSCWTCCRRSSDEVFETSEWY